MDASGGGLLDLVSRSVKMLENHTYEHVHSTESHSSPKGVAFSSCTVEPPGFTSAESLPAGHSSVGQATPGVSASSEAYASSECAIQGKHPVQRLGAHSEHTASTNNPATRAHGKQGSKVDAGKRATAAQSQAHTMPKTRLHKPRLG